LPKKGVTPTETIAKIWPWFEKISRDDSWRIRNEFACKIHRVAEGVNALGLDVDARPAVVECLLKLMSDPEPQVRQAVVKTLSKTVLHITIGKQLEAFCTHFVDLSSDANLDVREAASREFIDIFRNCRELDAGKLLEAINIFKNDENPKVRLNICERLDVLSSLIGDDQAKRKQLFANIQEWQCDPRWRVRAAIVGNIAPLALEMGLKEFDSSFFKELLVKSFTDPAFDVRQRACEQIPSLGEEFGLEYMTGLLQQLLHIRETKNYLHRMVIFDVMENYHCVLPKGQFNEVFSSIAKAGLSDAVPNVRVKAAQVVYSCASTLRLSPQCSSIINILQECTEHHDLDVKYFGRRALEEFQM